MITSNIFMLKTLYNETYTAYGGHSNQVISANRIKIQ